MKKEKVQNILSHPLFVVIFTALCLISIFSLRESAKKAQVSKESIQKLERSVEKAELELQEEDAKLADSQNDLVTEKIMRNELLQKKENEIVLQIPDQEYSELLEGEDTMKSGPLEEWKELLF